MFAVKTTPAYNSLGMAITLYEVVDVDAGVTKAETRDLAVAIRIAAMLNVEQEEQHAETTQGQTQAHGLP